MFDYLFLDDLTVVEEKALRGYKSANETTDGRSRCFDLNGDLRNGLKIGDLSQELREIAESIDTVFKRCPLLKEGVSVFRGVGERRCHPVHTVGSRFRSLQYWSTTLEQSTAENFLTPTCRGKGYGAVFEMKLPAGFRAYNMETLKGFGGDEHELLLPRDILWQVETTRIERPSKFLSKHFENIAHVVLIPKSWN